MSDIRVYTDEQVAASVAAGLRRRGIDALSASEAGRLGDADESQLAFAVAQGPTLLTQGADFLRLAAEGHPHLGIVYVPQRSSVGAIIRGIVALHRILTAEEMENRVEFL